MIDEVKGKKHKLSDWIINAVIIILCFFLLMTAGVMIGEFYDAYSQPYADDNLFYHIEDEQYFYLVNGSYRNIFSGFEGDAETQEYHGVGKYYEAASLYKAYEMYGNEEQAEFFLEKMEEAQKDMGGWDIAIKPIKKQLGIE